MFIFSAFKEAAGVPWSYPQIVYRINGGKVKYHKHQSYNLLTTFGLALTEARNRYNVSCFSCIFSSSVSKKSQAIVIASLSTSSSLLLCKNFNVAVKKWQ